MRLEQCQALKPAFGDKDSIPGRFECGLEQHPCLRVIIDHEHRLTSRLLHAAQYARSQQLLPRGKWRGSIVLDGTASPNLKTAATARSSALRQ